MKFSIQRSFVTSLALSSALLLSACGGGGSGSPTSSTPASQTSSQETTLQRGQFVDSAVSGLRYETRTQSGITDENGYFNFAEGETISFYLGDTKLGTVNAKALVTPLDLLSKDDHPDKLQNMLRILQTIDADADASNGIQINNLVNDYLKQFKLPLNDPAVMFEASSTVNNIIASVTNGSDLKNAVDSFTHFRETLLNKRRNITAPVILDLLRTTWDAKIISTECKDVNAKLVYKFFLLGITTWGDHGLAKDEEGVCQPSNRALLFSTYETDSLFACANSCTEADLNRVMVSEDEQGKVVTSIKYDQDNNQISITKTYFDDEKTQTTTTVMTKRS